MAWCARKGSMSTTSLSSHRSTEARSGTSLCFINTIELMWELNEMLQLSKRRGWNAVGTKEVFWVNTSILSYSKTVKTDTEKWAFLAVSHWHKHESKTDITCVWWLFLQPERHQWVQQQSTMRAGEMSEELRRTGWEHSRISGEVQSAPKITKDACF